MLSAATGGDKAGLIRTANWKTPVSTSYFCESHGSGVGFGGVLCLKPPKPRPRGGTESGLRARDRFRACILVTALPPLCFRFSLFLKGLSFSHFHIPLCAPACKILAIFLIVYFSLSLIITVSKAFVCSFSVICVW